MRFYDDLMRGDKIVVVNFMYTQCKGGCIGTMENLVKVQQALGDRAGRDIFFYSITLDPVSDTPAALKEYAALHETRPGWLFLTGQKADLELIRKNSASSMSIQSWPRVRWSTPASSTSATKPSTAGARAPRWTSRTKSSAPLSSIERPDRRRRLHAADNISVPVTASAPSAGYP